MLSENRRRQNTNPPLIRTESETYTELLGENQLGRRTRSRTRRALTTRGRNSPKNIPGSLARSLARPLVLRLLSLALPLLRGGTPLSANVERRVNPPLTICAGDSGRQLHMSCPIWDKLAFLYSLPQMRDLIQAGVL